MKVDQRKAEKLKMDIIRVQRLEALFIMALGSDRIARRRR
jgi:hypothetical protein